MKYLLATLILWVTAVGARAEAPRTAEAIFAGGCFWCVEADFEKLDGVIEGVSGYIGGQRANPSYEQVAAGKTRHAEAVRIVYQPEIVSYAELLDHFWRNIDPTVKNRQFCDSGAQYRSAIFTLDQAQRQAAEASKRKVEQRFDTVHTQIVDATTFYEAEDYHQDYYKKNPIRYNFYRTGCGRDRRLEQLWGDG